MALNHSYYMNLALKEARKGLGRTSPNPPVGAIIVKDNEIIGSGYHQKAGTNHAEVNAINSALGRDLKGSTIYVTLEPCNHTGRTPPCTHAILKYGIKKVVIGFKDPNPRVEGNGIDFLRSNGIEVDYGILEEECKIIVLPFLNNLIKEKPWVVMKAGISLDGKISYSKGSGGKITNRQSSEVTHQLRDSLDAILIGVETARIDNPNLTTRLKNKRGRDPLRIILDSELQLVPETKMLHQQSNAETWIFCTEKASDLKRLRLEQVGAKVIEVKTSDDNRVCLKSMLKYLHQSDICSILVEGGARIHGAFLKQNLVDEVHLFIAPFFIGDDGTEVIKGFSVTTLDHAKKFVRHSVDTLGSDIHFNGILRYPC